ncbi:dTDP-4-dehydrorhamnose 3,5-epimerase [Nitrospina gracilis]|uniref:dTDP-4-dehydrorhamnose 3,5-epimerase n=1 Tax=Nitrospina gracilis TaxID=35801 RepID=UPI001F0255A2|nr:dTDP-4-dehydrorhamnose 3,5-epimerase [Nitrospina gracilis]MCF8721338.1 dTDP-4-dehydrorhamnose 3,5-epimerase [Nitrospina gracilis Nb-211]
MKFIPTELDGVVLIEPVVHDDARGFFVETYVRSLFRDHGIDVDFVQDNHSQSSKGVLRGMHYQVRHGQAKLVRVVRGEVFDVAVDVRPGSPSFGRWTGHTLSANNRRQLFIPAGFAHGYCVLSDTAEVIYKCSDYYHPEDEGGLIWNDPEVGIDWPVEEPVLSEKDQRHPRLKDILPPEVKG